MGVHLGVRGFIPSHSLHSLHSQEHVTWLPASLLARNLASPCFGREPKARVMTIGILEKPKIETNIGVCNLNHVFIHKKKELG
jgi:hypothetical protein